VAVAVAVVAMADPSIARTPRPLNLALYVVVGHTFEA
jgi:hypothetical protein